MKSLKLKAFLIMVIIGIFMVCTPKLCYAANEEAVLVKQSENEYIIYMKQYLKQEFEFAFSNDNVADVSTLSFIPSAVDTANGENNIAYVDSASIGMFASKTYMWVKVDGEVKVSAREIDLTDNITKTELESVGTVSKIIPIKLEQEQIVNEVNEEGTQITETVGVVKLLNEMTNGKFQLIKREATVESNNLFALAELIEKNEFTDSYTKIKASKEFIELYNAQYNSLNADNWETIENSTIKQPVEAKTGDQYILYLKGDNIQDVHFLTSYRQYDEDFIKEEIRTKSPNTYDDNTILIALAVVVVAIVLVAIRIAALKKKEMNK